MRRVLGSVAALAVVLWATRGCRTQPKALVDPAGGALCPPAAGGVRGDLPCGVAAVLAARCQICHTIPRKHKAPWPQLSYEHVIQPFGITALLKWQRMAEVIEPGAQPHMPPRCYPQLSAEELGVLRAWFAACAPPVPDGTGCDLEDGGAFRGFDLAVPDGGVADGFGECDGP